jgi:hypothetical protein
MELHAAEARAMIVVTIASGLLQPICACGLRFGANRHTFRWNNFGTVDFASLGKSGLPLREAYAWFS